MSDIYAPSSKSFDEVSRVRAFSSQMHTGNDCIYIGSKARDRRNGRAARGMNMSLTKELKNPGSAISKWLDNNFDLDAPIHQLERQARGVGTIKPEGNLRDYPWSVVGSAVEFRIRQYCGIEYYSTTAALGGAGDMTTSMFHDALAVLWDDHVLDRQTTSENAWLLYFAGLFEGAFRSGNNESFWQYREVLTEMGRSNAWRLFRDDMELLRQGELRGFDSARHECLGLLPQTMQVPEQVLRDIARVGDAALGSSDFQVEIGSARFVDNPIFDGSAWVGGADGDFLFGHTLYDVKTTIRPENLWNSAIKQLVSYVALDLSDSYQIEELAVFLPRQHGLITRVDLDEILEHSAFISRQDMQWSVRHALEWRP